MGHVRGGSCAGSCVDPWQRRGRAHQSNRRRDHRNALRTFVCGHCRSGSRRVVSGWIPTARGEASAQLARCRIDRHRIRNRSRSGRCVERCHPDRGLPGIPVCMGGCRMGLDDGLLRRIQSSFKPVPQRSKGGRTMTSTPPPPTGEPVRPLGYDPAEGLALLHQSQETILVDQQLDFGPWWYVPVLGSLYPALFTSVSYTHLTLPTILLV